MLRMLLQLGFVLAFGFGSTSHAFPFYENSYTIPLHKLDERFGNASITVDGIEQLSPPTPCFAIQKEVPVSYSKFLSFVTVAIRGTDEEFPSAAYPIADPGFEGTYWDGNQRFYLWKKEIHVEKHGDVRIYHKDKIESLICSKPGGGTQAGWEVESLTVGLDYIRHEETLNCAERTHTVVRSCSQMNIPRAPTYEN